MYTWIQRRQHSPQATKNGNFFRFYWQCFCCWSTQLLRERRANPKRTVWRYWILSTQRSLHDDGSEKTKTDPWRALAEPLPASVIWQADMICSFSKPRSWKHQPKPAQMNRSLSGIKTKAFWLERFSNLFKAVMVLMATSRIWKWSSWQCRVCQLESISISTSFVRA